MSTPSRGLSATLDTLHLDAATADDRIAWTLDIAALALESRRSDGVHAAFEAHERHFRDRGDGAAVAKAVAHLRGVRVGLDPTAPRDEDLTSLDDAVRAVVEATGAGEVPYVRRVSYGVRAVNHVSLETRQGLRTFHLMHGNALAAPADVLVVSSHADATRDPDGQLVAALRWRWKMAVRDPGPLLRLPDGGWVSWLPDVPQAAPFRGVLLLRTPRARVGTDPVEELGRSLQGAFASLRALAYLGVPVGRITLPMIAGNRLQDVDHRARVTLREITRWLRAEETAERVQSVVFYEEELAIWNEAMDRVLGRTYIGPGQDAVLDGLHKDVLGRLAGVSDGVLAGSAGSLRAELLRSDGQLAVHTVCTFGRKLAEEMAGAMLRARAMKVHREFNNNIEALQKAGVIAPWVASYMHGLRVLGNESVHERGVEVAYSPRMLGKTDLAHGLAAIRALLEAWEHPTPLTSAPA